MMSYLVDKGQMGARRVLRRGDTLEFLLYFFIYIYTEVIPAVMHMDDKSLAQMIDLKRVFLKRWLDGVYQSCSHSL